MICVHFTTFRLGTLLFLITFTDLVFSKNSVIYTLIKQKINIYFKNKTEFDRNEPPDMHRSVVPNVDRTPFKRIFFSPFLVTRPDNTVDLHTYMFFIMQKKIRKIFLIGKCFVIGNFYRKKIHFSTETYRSEVLTRSDH